ncbi:pRL2-8 [Streptomyces anulatus]|uniref:pRL2-8 n=1 Tax=Streptomyces anulatus TaxID=1892 RepID=UPI0033D2732A
MAPSQKALTPPPGECRQCWLHAYDSRAQHAHLAPREDCPACVAHMLHGHGDMIVPVKRKGWW